MKELVKKEDVFQVVSFKKNCRFFEEDTRTPTSKKKKKKMEEVAKYKKSVQTLSYNLEL